MTETTTISASDVLCDLKAVVADLECQQKQQLLKQMQQQLQQEQELQKRRLQEKEREKKAPTQQPMYLMIPVEDTEKIEAHKRAHCGQDHQRNGSSKGSAQSQVKTEKVEQDKKKSHCSDSLELKGSKSRELRAGVLYTGCGCLHRDGLQDSCPRSECQGQPQCLTKPWATCPPGIRCRVRHPEIFGPPPNPDAVTF